MKTRKTVQKTIRLDVVVNLRNRLFKKQQEVAMYKKFYIAQAVECTKLEQRLKIEEHHTGFYADCTECLNFALAKSLFKFCSATSLLQQVSPFPQPNRT